MTINVTWLDDKRKIILCEVSGRFTWDEAFAKQKVIFGMLDTANHKVAIIIHAQVTQLPKSAVPAIRRCIERTHPNLSMRIVVGALPFMVGFFEIAAKFYPHLARHWYFVDTLEEAYTIYDCNQRGNDADARLG